MSKQLHNGAKKEFQLERLILLIAVYIPTLIPVVVKKAVKRINQKQ